MSTEGERLGLLVSAWIALIRRGDLGELAGILDEKVMWNGLRPELVCEGRAAVLEFFGRRRWGRMRITRLEAEEVADRVAISVEGPDFPETDMIASAAPRSLVFTFADGRVTRMDSYPSRDAAFAALR